KEDKERVFDAVDTVEKCLPVFTAMLATMTVNKEKMRSAAAGGFINATDCADYLVKKGMPFRDAYTVVGRLVNSCIAGGETLETLTLEEYKTASDMFENDVFDAIALETCIEMRKVPGGPSTESVKAQIETVKEFLICIGYFRG
ncbi:MAG: argininosuccinate lyase, partial [Clostridiales bacterium]|nr:argininosuccinate lyase [Clostridiales bacterium]